MLIHVFLVYFSFYASMIEVFQRQAEEDGGACVDKKA